MRAGKSPFLVPKQFTLEQRLRYRHTVQLHEWAIPPVTFGVDGFGYEFFTGAALTENQHRGIGLDDLGQRVEHSMHRRRLADEPAEGSLSDLPRAQTADLAHQLAALERPSHHHPQFVELDGLGEEVVRTATDRLDRGSPRPVCGHHDNQHVRLAPANIKHQIEALDVGQAVIEQDEVV